VSLTRVRAGKSKLLQVGDQIASLDWTDRWHHTPAFG
jgi:hypothetical protein